MDIYDVMVAGIILGGILLIVIVAGVVSLALSHLDHIHKVDMERRRSATKINQASGDVELYRDQHGEFTGF